MAFFARWWHQQTDEMKQTVRQLVNEGRLEFINGGWCMNDEATAYYTDTIDQLSLGLKFIQNEFGDCARPRVGWQVGKLSVEKQKANTAFTIWKLN